MITSLLEKSIRRTEAVDREALCIVAGEKVRYGAESIAALFCDLSTYFGPLQPNP